MDELLTLFGKNRGREGWWFMRVVVAVVMFAWAGVRVQ